MKATSINLKACYQEQDNRFPGSISFLLPPCTLLTGKCVSCPLINSGHLSTTASTTTIGTTVAAAATTNNSTTPIMAAAATNSWNTPVRVSVGDVLEKLTFNLVTDYTNRIGISNNVKKSVL